MKLEKEVMKPINKRLFFPLASAVFIVVFLISLAAIYVTGAELRISDRLLIGIVLLIASCLMLILLLVFQEATLKCPIRVYYVIVALWVFMFIAGGALVLSAMLPSRANFAERLLCTINMKKLEIVLDDYAKKSGGQYPEPYRWCDLLIEKINVPREFFINSSAPPARSHYGLNPGCEPNSPDDVVLLFEAKGGWNVCGGPRLMEFNNREDGCCNVLLNGGEVICIQRRDIRNLNWGKEIPIIDDRY